MRHAFKWVHNSKIKRRMLPGGILEPGGKREGGKREGGGGSETALILSGFSGINLAGGELSGKGQNHKQTVLQEDLNPEAAVAEQAGPPSV
jgi:hypothetical protein